MIILPAQKKVEVVKRDKAIKTVYCLYRVSTKNQVDENDIPMQRLACHEFVSQNPGWFIRREFYDNGIEVWSVKEGQQVFDSYVDDLMNYIRFWTAKTESIKIALRVRTRLRQMVEEGKYTGGTKEYDINFMMRNDYADFV